LKAAALTAGFDFATMQNSVAMMVKSNEIVFIQLPSLCAVIKPAENIYTTIKSPGPVMFTTRATQGIPAGEVARKCIDITQEGSGTGQATAVANNTEATRVFREAHMPLTPDDSISALPFYNDCGSGGSATCGKPLLAWMGIDRDGVTYIQPASSLQEVTSAVPDVSCSDSQVQAQAFVMVSYAQQSATQTVAPGAIGMSADIDLTNVGEI